MRYILGCREEHCRYRYEKTRRSIKDIFKNENILFQKMACMELIRFTE